MVGYAGETSHTFSAQGISLFLLATGRIQRGTKDSDSQTERLSFRSNQRALRYEEFLHTKINNKDVYVDYGATEDIPENACSFRRQYYGSWRDDGGQQ